MASELARKRVKHEDVNVRLNSAIFQSLLATGTLENMDQALTFAENWDFKIDNSRLYGSSEHSSVFEMFFQTNACLSKEEALIINVLNLLLQTNAHHGLNELSIYEVMFTMKFVPSFIIDWCLAHNKEFPITSTPSLVNLLTLTKIKKTGLEKEPQIEDFSCRVME